MQSFIVSFNAVVPLFVMMGIGYIFKKKEIMSPETIHQLNRSTYLFFTPVLLFKNIYQTELDEVFDLKLLLFVVGSVLVILGIAFLVTFLVEKRAGTRGAMIQGIYRSNFTLFGLPILIFMYGGSNIGITSFILALLAPLYNVTGVVTLEYFGGKRTDFMKLLTQVAANPLMIGTLLGVVVMLLGVDFPVFVASSIDSLASIAIPLALITMGASFTMTTVKSNKRNMALTVIMRLVIVPAIFVFISILMGFRDLELATLLILFASPTAVVSYTMAKQMNCDGDFACSVVVFTTLFSSITVFLWLVFLQHFGFVAIP